MKTLQQEWDEITLSKVFEIEVIDKRTNEIEYILFDISMDENLFIAQHESMNELQEKSNKIAFTQIEIDSDFSLDRNLQELYSACIDTILESDFFELAG